MDIKLKYFVMKDVQMVDVYTGELSGVPFDEHVISAVVGGQEFKEAFQVTSLMKEQRPREEALLFGMKMQEIGKMIQKQAIKGDPNITICSNGKTFITF